MQKPSSYGKPPETAGIGRIAELLGPALDRAERRRSGHEQPVRTPWPQLDNIMGGGMWPGAHFLVAGTGVGKSQLTFQLALHAASAGAPVGLIALELDEMSLSIRLAAEQAGVVWSKVYNGKASNEEMARLRSVTPEIAKLNIRCDFGQAMGWSIDRLELMAKALREDKPTGPILICLDFIQLVANRPGEKPVDLRERISQAGYTARNIARRYDASVAIISSTARNNYGALNQKLSKAGICVEESRFGTRRVVRYPDTLIGLGKESGELEFAADSLTVLMRPTITQGQHDAVVGELVSRGAKIVAVVVPKMRAGVPSWFAMAFEHGRFHQLEDSTINSLAQAPSGEDDDETEIDTEDKLVAAIAEQLATSPINPIHTKEVLFKAAGVGAKKGNPALEALLEQGRIGFTKGHGFVMGKPL